uniref:Putative ovule protein n=1 Tax=Solanum chacoense TaxID=4108 RepID=A0A0V0GN29_SOLCH
MICDGVDRYCNGGDFQIVMVKFDGYHECSTKLLRRKKEIRDEIVVLDEIYPSFLCYSHGRSMMMGVI